MFWKPEPLWSNQTVFIVGGGPSLKGFDFNCLRGLHVLVVNEAYRDVPWAEVLFFKDGDWFLRVRPDLVSPPFEGLIVTVSSAAKSECSHRINLVECNVPEMPRARTSGHMAVSLALTMKAKRIVLLGFDWNPEGGNYHNRHLTRGLQYRGGLVESWKKYEDRARKSGCEIWNATPESKIENFPLIDFEDVWNENRVF